MHEQRCGHVPAGCVRLPQPPCSHPATALPQHTCITNAMMARWPALLTTPQCRVTAAARRPPPPPGAYLRAPNVPTSHPPPPPLPPHLASSNTHDMYMTGTTRTPADQCHSAPHWCVATHQCVATHPCVATHTCVATHPYVPHRTLVCGVLPPALLQVLAGPSAALARGSSGGRVGGRSFSSSSSSSSRSYSSSSSSSSSYGRSSSYRSSLSSPSSSTHYHTSIVAPSTGIITG